MIRRILPFVVTLALVACGSDSPSQPTPPPAQAAATISSIALSAPTVDIEVGQTVTVTATATMSDGSQSTPSLTWSSDNTGVATVDANRAVRGVGPGTATIIGRAANGVTGTRLFTVRPAGPKTTFSAGQYLVNTDIAAGRYYSSPQSGCYWERQSGLGGSLSEIIANDFVAYRANQYIVDVLPSDLAFEADSDCGTWRDTTSLGAQATITPGVWLVGAQVAPGTYRANVSAGCYWERLRNFEHRLASIISNDFVGSAGQQFVTIQAGDLGFHTDGDCGTWTRVENAAEPSGTQPHTRHSNVSANLTAARSKRGLLR